ncbi:MAG: tRNA 2-selenouridine(34) synthase MnmH [Bacteroidales bacterium]|jgi:tRNA 2-selenouridine synthase|nr:tRNA 2-selenouridine(34) synthase MnmH [Bacteroidales bacterium]
MNRKKTDAATFLELSKTIPVCDVRSPHEYDSGHIPGAVNIPLFTDTERKAVGIKYKHEGRMPAINEGLSLAGPHLAGKLDAAHRLSADGRLLVYCWRGGMRSESMAWLFSLAGIRTCVLEGGYKAYRRHILAKLAEQRKLIILGGLTGSGKTHILNYLKTQQQQSIDLEGLASHKGSAFGALGQAPQPTTEHFANILYREWAETLPSAPLWLEDESRNIGSVFMPEKLYGAMQNSPVIVLMMDMALRLPRLQQEYSAFPENELAAAVQRIARRLGGSNVNEALKAIAAGNFARAIEITLTYYDRAYLYGLSRKPPQNIIYVHTDTDNVNENAGRILEAAGRIKWVNCY